MCACVIVENFDWRFLNINRDSQLLNILEYFYPRGVYYVKFLSRDKNVSHHFLANIMRYYLPCRHGRCTKITRKHNYEYTQIASDSRVCILFSMISPINTTFPCTPKSLNLSSRICEECNERYVCIAGIQKDFLYSCKMIIYQESKAAKCLICG